jgi:hypothetical protein
MRRAARTDSNHAAIRDELRDMGFEVFDTHALGNGYPDLHVSKNGWSALVEVKASVKATLTPDEWDFHRRWQGLVIIAIITEDVVDKYNRWAAER